MFAYPENYRREQENERDFVKMKEIFPEDAKEILRYIEDECDKMEHDGSLMFAQYPDRMGVRRIGKRIRTHCPKGKNWTEELIEALLCEEIYRRRCRRRNCRMGD